jgi:hypothetical protein
MSVPFVQPPPKEVLEYGVVTIPGPAGADHMQANWDGGLVVVLVTLVVLVSTHPFPLLLYPGEHVHAHDTPRSVSVHFVFVTKPQEELPHPNEVRFVLFITPNPEGVIHQQVGWVIITGIDEPVSAGREFIIQLRISILDFRTTLIFL